MRPLLLRIVFVLTASGCALGQPTADSQILQALLAEVRQLRLDLQNVTLAAQRVQILLYRLQLQEASTARASQRYDQASARLHEAQQARTRAAAALQELEDAHNRAPEDAAQRKAIEERLPEVKHTLEIWTADEQTRQAAESEAQGQLRTEQAKLSELQDALDKLDKFLTRQ